MEFHNNRFAVNEVSNREMQDNDCYFSVKSLKTKCAMFLLSDIVFRLIMSPVEVDDASNHHCISLKVVYNYQ